MGGSGGHADTAAGAKLAIVTTRLNAGGYAKVVERVTTVTTPGETVDVIVTEAGVAVNPRREELRERLAAANVPVVPIGELEEIARRGAVHAPPAVRGERTVAVVEYRDGTVTDIISAIA
jgi:citrate lyase subunit alpha/citrate CoA-transferase